MNLLDVINTRFSESLSSLTNNLVILAIYETIDTLLANNKKSIFLFKAIADGADTVYIYRPISVYDLETGIEYVLLEEKDITLSLLSPLKARNIITNGYAIMSDGKLLLQNQSEDVTIEYIPLKESGYYIYSSFDKTIIANSVKIKEDIYDLVGCIYIKIFYTGELNKLAGEIVSSMTSLSSSISSSLSELILEFNDKTEFDKVISGYNNCYSEWDGSGGIKSQLESINEYDYSGIITEIEKALTIDYLTAFQAEKEMFNSKFEESYPILLTKLSSINTNTEERLASDDIEIASGYSQQFSSINSEISNLIQDNASKMSSALSQYFNLLADTIQRANGYLSEYSTLAQSNSQRVQSLIGTMTTSLQILANSIQIYSLYLQSLNSKWQSYSQLLSVKIQELANRGQSVSLYSEKIKLANNYINEILGVTI